MTPVDPSFVTDAGRTASEYLDVYKRLWPIAVTGGLMGAAIHCKEIYRSPSKLEAVFCAATEWTVGASAAMVLATLLPSVAGLLPDGINLMTPEAELGLCGFIGGTFGRRVFRYMWSKFFRVSTERGKQ